MRSIRHYFRHGRRYHRHEKWAVVAGLFTLTLLVSGASSFFATQGKAYSKNIEVKDMQIESQEVVADGQSSSRVKLSIDKAGSEVPAASTWVGLKVEAKPDRTPDFTYLDWYSPEPSRAFFQTDARGEVEFEVKSKIPGSIRYDIFVANPENKTQSQFIPLDKSFTINFLKPTS